MKPDEKEAKEKYKIVAEHYHNWRTKIHPEGWIYNEFLEMPATFELLGNLKGKKVLDMGCGAGIYAKAMSKKGAKAKGFDISPEMLAIARKENPKLDLRSGTVYNIPFKEKFDIVTAPLVIDYAQDWDRIFKQVYRILKKRGCFIFSVGNPVTDSTEKIIRNGKRLKIHKIPARAIWNYFNEKKVYGTWRNILYKKEVQNVQMPGYHKTYETIIRTIIKNKFEIAGYIDCFPLKKAKKLFPKQYAFLSKVPYFCVWKLRKK